LTAKKRLTALLVLFALSAANLMAQTDGAVEDDRSGWPQWLRDLRRWEIVAFGSFPFTMFFATIGMDLYRWHREAGMSWNNRGFAPWPITSSPAIPMTDREQRITIGIAAGLSVGVAIVDHFIVRGRRQRERRRAEALPAGTVIVTRTPFLEEPEEYYDAAVDDDGFAPEAGDSEDAALSVPGVDDTPPH